MYNDISFGMHFRKVPFLKMQNDKPDFEVNPLDINIARIQMDLLSRLEREVPENGDFAPVYEEYQSKSPILDLGSLKVVCKYVKDDSPKKETRSLEAIRTEKGNNKESSIVLKKGTKQEILEYLHNNVQYFNTCKKFANK